MNSLDFCCLSSRIHILPFGIIHKNFSYYYPGQNCYNHCATFHLYVCLTTFLHVTHYELCNMAARQVISRKNQPFDFKLLRICDFECKKAPKIGAKPTHVTQCILCHIKLKQLITETRQSSQSKLANTRHKSPQIAHKQIIYKRITLSTKKLNIMKHVIDGPHVVVASTSD